MKDMKLLNEKFPLYINGTSKREIRHNFFSSIETEIQAYLLGFIASDGSINDERHTLTIRISIKDEHLLEFFKIISPDAYIQKIESKEHGEIRGKIVKSGEAVRLSISSKILIEDLHKLGIVERKTYSDMYIPKQIPERLIKHFIRGYFDGDGSIMYSVREPNPKNREKNPRVTGRFEICAKKSSILLDIQKYLPGTSLTYIKRDDMYRLNASSKVIISNIFKLFYDDCNYCLSRKFNKFNYYVNTEVSQIITDHRNAQEVSVNESNNLPKSAEIDNDWLENNYFDYL